MVHYAVATLVAIGGVFVHAVRLAARAAGLQRDVETLTDRFEKLEERVEKHEDQISRTLSDLGTRLTAIEADIKWLVRQQNGGRTP
ncbi:ABC transporter C-terminal domain-containing protein [Rhodovastum atsumiense]|uniref:Prefoldin subunit n=1 Tax=Rhodovastum atsumiense TaxID=504468 RepID=A0A5M6IUH6_9PROT|nr:ABC transporter C-terminal domain-containing protein [Rhodovastum atsumiense]KAA5611891.1 prefoldin subunit [Rhodovastum atsumiense]